MKGIKGLIELFSEDNGNLSSMRLLAFFIVVVVMINWTMMNWKTGVLHGFDWMDLGVVLGPLGAKAWQKGKETEVEPKGGE